MITRNDLMCQRDMAVGEVGRWDELHDTLARLRANPQEFSRQAVSGACDILDFDMGIHVEVEGVLSGHPRAVHHSVVYRNKTRDLTGERHLGRWLRRCRLDPAMWAREDPAWAFLLSQRVDPIRTVTVRAALQENWESAVESNRRRHMHAFTDLWGGWFKYLLCDRLAVVALYTSDRRRDELFMPDFHYGMTGWAYHQIEGDYGPKTGHPYLTPSERAVAVEMATSLSSKQIAAKLHKKKSTINTMISHIAKKYGVEGRIEYIVRVAFPWQRID